MSFLRKLIPPSLISLLEKPYHYCLAFLGALSYRFPSRDIYVVGITGTKGKTTTTELVNLFLEKKGYKTALLGTLRFKIGEKSERNMLKMTMPGRFFIQKFLRQAVDIGCTHVVIEMSSEGAKQFRHTFIDLDALVFTNLSPEHIESHGSYENYRAAKLSIAKRLESGKPRTIIVVNHNDTEAGLFLSVNADKKLTYSPQNLDSYQIGKNGITFSWKGVVFESSLKGEFNLYNILAAMTLAQALGISDRDMQEALRSFAGVRGRVEEVWAEGRAQERQNFKVIVDYAHTTDSLSKLYGAFEGQNRICVLGGTGGGRDRWKREEMGKVASNMCKNIILTNEDPYDEDPEKIIEDIAKGITRPHKVILNRREAIATAIQEAKANDVVLISGKGTDPYIMEKNGTKTPWDDAKVAREELTKALS
ncbi:MAG: UDP-N-acetylmuramyl-tripeptide synthetase [Patescibacteria group bacterium]